MPIKSFEPKRGRKVCRWGKLKCSLKSLYCAPICWNKPCAKGDTAKCFLMLGGSKSRENSCPVFRSVWGRPAGRRHRRAGEGYRLAPSEVGLQKILSGRKLTQKEREGAGLQQSKWKTKQQKGVGGRCQGREKVTAAVLEETPAQGAEWQQDGYPCADELSPFPGARPMGGMPRTRLTQVTWGGCWDCYRRSPEWTHFPPLRIPLSILYKPPGEFRIAIRRRKGEFPNRTKFQVRKYCKVTGQAWEGPESSPRDVAKRVGSALGTNTLQGPRASGGSTSVREKTNELVALMQ